MAEVIIVGAGEGKRIQNRVPKPYIKLKGKPIIALTLKVFNEIDEIEDIIVVSHSEWVRYCKSKIVEELGFKKVRAVVKGGIHRQDSVRAGLEAISSLISHTSSFLLIHDAVRPFITRDFITHLIKVSAKYEAVIPAIPSTNTIKEVEDGWVHHTLPRKSLYEIQTPQVFKYEVIKEAYDKAYSCNFYGTDDSSLVERIGIPVKVVPGLPSNIKITTREDLLYAEKLL